MGNKITKALLIALLYLCNLSAQDSLGVVQFAGIGAATQSAIAGDSIHAGDAVCLLLTGPAINLGKLIRADLYNEQAQAIGVSLITCGDGDTGKYILSGIITNWPGLKHGNAYYLQETAGAIDTFCYDAGRLCQKIGIALTDSTFLVAPEDRIDNRGFVYRDSIPVPTLQEVATIGNIVDTGIKFRSNIADEGYINLFSNPVSGTYDLELPQVTGTLTTHETSGIYGGDGSVPIGTEAYIPPDGLGGDNYSGWLFAKPSWIESQYFDNFKEVGIQSYNTVSLNGTFIGYNQDEPQVLKIRSWNNTNYASQVLAVSPNNISINGKIELVSKEDGVLQVNDGAEFKIKDLRGVRNGIEYDADYSENLKSNDRSIPDVETVRKVARPYKVYTARISQIDTDPITPQFVYENTIGGILFTRNGEGDYTITFDNPPASRDNIFIMYTPLFTNTISMYTIINQDINIKTFAGGSPSDNVIENMHLEIRIYP